MAKYRPIRLGEIETDDLSIKGIGLATSTLGILNGKQIFLCGDEDCRAPIIYDTNSERPIICTQCGEEIDWSDRFTSKVKICSKCNTKYYRAIDKFCYYHIPRVPLVEKEIEKILDEIDKM